MHQRQAIRAAAKAALLSQTVCGANVFTTRVYAYDPVANASPGCMIYTIDEESQFDTLGPRRSLARGLKLAIEGIFAENGTIDDTLDAFAVEVERALANNPTLSGACKDLMLSRTQIAMRKDGEKLTGAIVLTFDVAYRTLATDPTSLA